MRYVFAGLAWLALVLPAHAQKEFNVWCFGVASPRLNATGIRNERAIMLSFDAAGPVHPNDSCIMKVVNNAVQTLGGATGCGSICDARGNLLMYMDGISLFDRNQRVMPGGFRLNDALSSDPVPPGWNWAINQTGVFIPGPDGLYYVFYSDWASVAGEALYYPKCAVVDMRLNGGYGAVVRKQPLLPTRNLRVTAVRHRNNRDFWFITHDLDTRGFLAYLVDKNGVSATPVVSRAVTAFYPNGDEFKASPNGTRLTCGAYTRAATGPKNCRCVYDFDNATGAVTNEVVVRQNPIADYLADSQGRPLGYINVCTASFSPNSDLLYVSEYFFNPADIQRRSDLWQYDLTQPTPEAMSATRFLVTNIPTPPAPLFLECLGMQLAPDGTLWIGSCLFGPLVDPSNRYYTSMSSAIVRHPDVVGAGCGLEVDGYRYRPGHRPIHSFPNVITNMLYAPPTLNYAVGCAEDSVQLWASSAGLPAGLRWDFGDPTSGPANAASGGQVAHRYARSGSYPVRLRLADGRVLTQTITVAAQAVDFTDANVFTPNHDGLNDAFVPVQGALPGGRLRVFSRWGVPVFGTAEAAALRWDGAGAAAGEYFYQLDYPDCQGQPRQRRGVVTLVR